MGHEALRPKRLPEGLMVAGAAVDKARSDAQHLFPFSVVLPDQVFGEDGFGVFLYTVGVHGVEAVAVHPIARGHLAVLDVEEPEPEGLHSFWDLEGGTQCLDAEELAEGVVGLVRFLIVVVAHFPRTAADEEKEGDERETAVSNGKRVKHERSSSCGAGAGREEFLPAFGRGFEV